MDHETFIDVVAGEAGTGREQAERAMSATLQTLGEHLDREEARQVAAQLPPEVAPWIAKSAPGAERFDADEFLRRVAQRAGVDVGDARRHAAAVLDALSRAVSTKEWDDLVAELPSDFAPLLPRGPYVAVVEADTFLGLVAEHAGLDRDGARHAAEAVLETLAERIAGGEVDDLTVRLPLELHPPLRRGRDASGGQARRMGAAEFVHRVAELEGVSDLEAARHSRAVLLTLREAVGDEEFRDVAAQLPDDFLRTLAR
ncbi:MAG: hypothetical protein QOF26_2171 [Baekduia sp.]|jgi:uncharacterized protein (DUF2267 family)|nr:hypothetical protein [Baekduia sp.]